jgi:pyridoxine 5-phosphate synthase
MEELAKLKDAALAANKLGLKINAGHGLNYVNVSAVSAINNVEELNIGHAIISRAVLTGLDTAVRDMLALL